MTTELDIARQDGRAEIVPALPKPGTTAAALDMLRGHAEMMSAAHQLASAMVKTAMVPAAYRGKADDAAAAILYGAEIGLNPIQALQQVFPIHGQPAIYARTMVALLKARGFRFRTIESTNDSVTVAGTSPSGETEESTWTIERADRAGYTTNKKYETDPQAMLYAKACAEVCRKLAPDVLLGISHTREDLELEPVRVESERVPSSQWKPVAEILAEESPAEAPKVQQWRPPADEDAATPAEPEPPQDEAAAEPPKRTKKADLEEATALMDQLGFTTPDDRRRFVRELFQDDTLTATVLTAEQRAYLLTELRGVIAEREGRDSVAEATIAADAGQQTLDAEGGAQ